MSTNQSPTYLNQFAWEQWENKVIFVLYRSDRRYVVKRYAEQVLASSPQWKQLAQSSSFSKIEPISRTYKITDNEIKLLNKIFSWHLNGIVSFKTISATDQLVEWEDLLDFIERAKQAAQNTQRNEANMRSSSSSMPTIPTGASLPELSTKKIPDSHESSEKSRSKRKDVTPTKVKKKVQEQQCVQNENNHLPSSDSWIQINNICVPCIMKSPCVYLLPYQILLDCDLINEKEQAILVHFITKASSKDLEAFQEIISKSSSIDFKLNDDLNLIDLFHLIFGMSKVVYVKLLNNQRDVNKSYKTVLAHRGGIVQIRSHSTPFITVGKHNYILLDALIKILQPTTQTQSIFRRYCLLPRSHEIDYLRLVQFYQRKENELSSIESNQKQQFLVNVDEIYKYVDDENDLIIDMSLSQYQQMEFQKLKKQMEISENRQIRKPTKRKANTPMNELQMTATKH